MEDDLKKHLKQVLESKKKELEELDKVHKMMVAESNAKRGTLAKWIQSFEDILEKEG